MLWAQRLFGSMFGLFAATAMLLATCGLYAVTLCRVTSNARNRPADALRADPRRVWLAVASTTLRHSRSASSWNAWAVAVSTVLPAILVGSGGTNFLAIAALAVLLVIAGIVASAVPARRAMRLDPTTALQAE
jgi:ABC-type antimicrobial peptide transport system permease subunit